MTFPVWSKNSNDVQLAKNQGLAPSPNRPIWTIRPEWACHCGHPSPRYDRAMISVLHPWQIVVLALAGWINRQQLDVIEYLKEENRVLREHLKGKRIRFTDEQRRRLAA